MFLDCKDELENLINNEYKKRYPDINRKSKLILPTSYGYIRNNDILYLTVKEVAKNMQNDSNAFDSWALAIKYWVPSIKKVVLKWDRYEDKNEGNYQRFLYRVKKATEVYHQWLEVDNSCKPYLDDSLIKPEGEYLVNAPSYIFQEVATRTEAKIERMFIASYNDVLANAVDMDNNLLYNQLPVGLFKDEIADQNAIFSSGKADIWGLSYDKKELHIFELKKPGASPMGIYSELFFYAMFEKDIIDRKFIYKDKDKIKCYRGICELIKLEHETIKAHFLATKVHPLIDSGMVDMINEALKPYDIQFDYIRYNIDVEPVKDKKIYIKQGWVSAVRNMKAISK